MQQAVSKLVREVIIPGKFMALSGFMGSNFVTNDLVVAYYRNLLALFRPLRIPISFLVILQLLHKSHIRMLAYKYGTLSRQSHNGIAYYH